MKKHVLTLALASLVLIGVNLSAVTSDALDPTRDFETSYEILQDIQEGTPHAPFFVCPEGDLRSCEQAALQAFRDCAAGCSGAVGSGCFERCAIRFNLAVDICQIVCLI